MGYYHKTTRMLKLKKIDILSVGKDGEQLELWYTAVGHVKYYNYFGRQSVTFYTSIWLNLRYLPKRNENLCLWETHILIFIAALYIIAPDWKLLNCPFTDEWINNLQNIHTIYPAIKENKLLTHATTLMIIKNIPSQRSQTQKNVLFDCIYMKL